MVRLNMETFKNHYVEDNPRLDYNNEFKRDKLNRRHLYQKLSLAYIQRQPIFPKG